MFHMGQTIGAHYQKKTLKDDLVLIAAPEGEQHEIGILGASLLCVHYGIKFIYMGANLPAKSLCEAANALKPKYILLGVIVGHELNQKKTLEEYLNEVATEITTPSQIIIGGNLRPYVRSELEKRRIPCFPTLQAFDEWLLSL